MINSIVLKIKRIKLSLRSKNNLLKYEPAIIDFIFYKFEQSKAVQFGNKKKYTQSRYFKNLKSHKSFGINIKIPLQAENYIKSVYGKNWLTRPDFYNNTKRRNKINHA